MGIGLLAKITVQEGKNAEFEQVFLDLTEQVRANEPGNIFYCQVSPDDAQEIISKTVSNGEVIEPEHGVLAIGLLVGIAAGVVWLVLAFCAYFVVMGAVQVLLETGLQDEIDVTLTVAGDSGAISASVGSTAPSINLTTEGSADWVHWALNSASSVNRKSGVAEQISDIAGSTARRFVGGNSRASYTWTDGTPTGSTTTSAGLYFSSAGSTIQFTVPADPTPRTLTVHLGGYQARGRIEVSLSDGTVPPFVTTVQDLANPFDRTLTVDFQAASPGQTLTVRPGDSGTTTASAASSAPKTVTYKVRSGDNLSSIASNSGLPIE